MRYCKFTNIFRKLINYLRIISLKRYVVKQWILLKIVIYSLFYNSHTSVLSTFEACVQPGVTIGSLFLRKGGFVSRL